MKGWITVDPSKVIETVDRFGRLQVLDDRELVVEVEKAEDLQNLQKVLKETFGKEVDLEAIVKK
jgi:hypothetical protein